MLTLKDGLGVLCELPRVAKTTAEAQASKKNNTSSSGVISQTMGPTASRSHVLKLHPPASIPLPSIS